MSEQLPSHSFDDSFNVVTWNILLDKTRTKRGLMKPQSERLPSQAETLQSLGIELDVVAIQEAHITRKQHGGEELARQLGFAASFWQEHNTSKRRGDAIGMFGNLVDRAEFFDLGHDKLGVLTYIGSVAVVGVHLRNEYFGPMRADQTSVVLDKLQGDERAVVMGDFNAIPLERPHRLLQAADFVSAFEMNGRSRPKTWPTEKYRSVMYPKALRGVAPGFQYDDIYVRGLEVEWAELFVGDSDHKGLVARVSVS